MDFLDAYDVLGVAPHAPQDDLKAAYRALVRRHHPDLGPARPADADRRVREINVAYGLVHTPEVRRRYDHLRRAHAARRTAQRIRGTDETELAAQWEELSRAAGRRAGEWMHRRRGLSYLAGRALGRWLN